MKTDMGNTIRTIGCHQERETNSSGRPTAVLHACSAPSRPRSPRIHSRSGLELRATFFAPAASASSTQPQETSAITCTCWSDMR